MIAAETRRFDFENGRSVQPNDTYMLSVRILDTGLYSFCYGRIAVITLEPAGKASACRQG